MEVIVHGTKGGYKVLYQTPNAPFSIARDVRRIDRNDGSTVGQTAYSIAFSNNGCVYTKYVIVRDILREAVGNIAFSVYIPNNKKIKGNDVKTLLDQLSGTYCQAYVVDGNLGTKHEDWTFCKALVNQYENLLHPVWSEDVETILQGVNDAAFIHYNSNDELIKYLDAPYQQEYRDYIQVFFVQKDSNPLNALKHDPASNLTGKIDLDSYKLIFNGENAGGLAIKVWAQGDEKSRGDKIRKSDILTISFRQQYRKPEKCKGTWEEIKQQHPDKIEIDDENRSVRIHSIQLLPESKTVTITVIDHFSQKPIKNVQIFCYVHNFWKEIKNNQLLLEGDEIGGYSLLFVVKADKADGYESFQEHRNLQGCSNIIIELKKKGVEEWKRSDEIEPWGEEDERKLPRPPIKVYVQKAAILIGVLLLSLLIIYLIIVIFKQKPTDKITKVVNIEAIEAYTQNDRLLPDSLHEYKNRIKSLMPSDSQEPSLLSRFFRQKPKRDYSSVINKIDSAILIREAIAYGNVKKLQGFTYSANQQKFKEAIAVDSIEAIKLIEFRNDLTLSGIADAIFRHLKDDSIAKQQRIDSINQSQQTGRNPVYTNSSSVNSILFQQIEEYLKGTQLLPTKLYDYKDQCDILEKQGINKSDRQTLDRLDQAIEFRAALMNDFHDFDYKHRGKVNQNYPWGKFWSFIKNDKKLQFQSIENVMDKPLSEVMAEYGYSPQ